ncbi:MAG: PIN domain-containing protein [Gemmatimonadaceae bacterium]|nr:PIN domain-containing protein [Gemmatimonadaceae bacterium]
MRLLLDTHVLIWWDAGEPIAPAAARAIQTADQVFVSAASAWELAIKTALGKVVTSRALATVIDENGFIRTARARAPYGRAEHAPRPAS